MKTHLLKVLKLNDLVLIENRIYKIVLKPCSNGTQKWEIPILRLFKLPQPPKYKTTKNKKIKKSSGFLYNELKEKSKANLTKILRKIKLNKNDFPIDEGKIKKKNIKYKVNAL